MTEAQNLPDPEKMVATVHAYVAAFEAGDADRVAELYAEDAICEDPVGIDPYRGREAIRAFYVQSMATGAKLKLEGPIRVVRDYVAFPFSVNLNYDGGPKRIDVIDTFRFNAAGEIVEMRAFWGQTNMHGF